MSKTIDLFIDESCYRVERESIARFLPHQPGTYQFFDDSGILYVGKSKNLSKRLSQYKHAIHSSKHDKMKRLFQAFTSIKIQTCKTDHDALLEENKLIQLHRPPLNVAGAYFFLYPFLGISKQTDPNAPLTLIYSTNGDIFNDPEYEVFGAFRSRSICKEAFDRLAYLMGIVGHKETGTEKHQSNLAFTSAKSFRQVPRSWLLNLDSFLSGRDSKLLVIMAYNLLEKPQARKKSAEIQDHLKFLMLFFREEANKLRLAMESSGINANAIPQKLRDPLFIKLPKYAEAIKLQ